jgi:hypothetical protein
MNHLVVLVGSLLLAACGDVVTRRYDALQDARNDQLFERGWLPDVLPPSARNIRVTSNLDLNTSVGEFHFAPHEFRTLRDHLSPYDSADVPADIRRQVQAYNGSGHSTFQFIDVGSAWVFFCVSERGVCEFTMSPRD